MAQPADRPRAWPWLLVLVAALVAGVLLAWRPWASTGPGGTAATPSSSPTAPVPTAPASTAPVGPELDGTDAVALFFTDAELAEVVPLAAGLALAHVEDPMAGLPPGSAVAPPDCTPAVTVVVAEPVALLRRFAGGDAVTVVQSVHLLADAGTATEAFDLLVGTLGTCDAYEQQNPGIDGAAWTSEPPTADDGPVPTVVRRLTLTAEGAVSPEVEVTALVGNALVTTTVSGVDPESDPADPGVLARGARAAGERVLGSAG